MKALSAALIAISLLTACSSDPYVDARPLHGIAAQDAVQMAAGSAPRGVMGVFKLHVRATGEQDGRLYLNSEEDYRDQRNVAIEIPPAAAKQLSEQLGADPLVALKDKDLLVAGVAQRVTIYFYDNDGRRTDKYYYQTHVRVYNPQQIVIRD